MSKSKLRKAIELLEEDPDDEGNYFCPSCGAWVQDHKHSPTCNTGQVIAILKELAKEGEAK